MLKISNIGEYTHNTVLIHSELIKFLLARYGYSEISVIVQTIQNYTDVHNILNILNTILQSFKVMLIFKKPLKQAW